MLGNYECWPEIESLVSRLTRESLWARAWCVWDRRSTSRVPVQPGNYLLPRRMANLMSSSRITNRRASSARPARRSSSCQITTLFVTVRHNPLIQELFRGDADGPGGAAASGPRSFLSDSCSSARRVASCSNDTLLALRRKRSNSCSSSMRTRLASSLTGSRRCLVAPKIICSIVTLTSPGSITRYPYRNSATEGTNRQVAGMPIFV
jgi:hypothetical protein